MVRTVVSPLAEVRPRVALGAGSVVEEFVLLGASDRPSRPATLASRNVNGVGRGSRPLRIGPGARLRSHTVIYGGNAIGRNFQTGHGALLREGNRIGNDVVVGSLSVVEGRCRFEDRAVVHSNCYIGEETVLRRNAWVGPGAVTLNTKLPRCAYKEACFLPPVVGRDAVVGGGAVLMPGVTVGESAMVAAGAVVTQDVPPRTLVVGSPARVVKPMDEVFCLNGRRYRRAPR